jgi:integrase
MSQRLFKVIKSYTDNNDYSFQDLKDFIDEKILEDQPKAKTIATRYSLTKKFLRDNYQEISEKQLKLIRPEDDITLSIIEKDLEIKSNKKNIKFDKDLIDKILEFKETDDVYLLSIYLQFISGRRADEIRDKQYKIRVGKDNKLKMQLSKKNEKSKNKFYNIELIKDTISPKQFKDSINIVRQNFQHIQSTDYIKRLNRRIKKEVRSDLTSHNLRGIYSTYMFHTQNENNQNINGFISSVLNHDSDNSSLNYSNYIYTDANKNEEVENEEVENDEKKNEEVENDEKELPHDL